MPKGNEHFLTSDFCKLVQQGLEAVVLRWQGQSLKEVCGAITDTIAAFKRFLEKHMNMQRKEGYDYMQPDGYHAIMLSTDIVLCCVGLYGELCYTREWWVTCYTETCQRY